MWKIELKLIYEPVYERYEEGEVLLDPNGVPIQEMEQVPIFEERETTYVTTKEEPVEAFWDPEKREYHIWWKMKQTGPWKKKR